MPFPSGYQPPIVEPSEEVVEILPELEISVPDMLEVPVERVVPTFAVEEGMVEPEGWADKLRTLADSFSLEQGSSLLDTYILPIMGAVFCIGFLRIVYRYYHKQELYLQKLWLFLLFFLSKRQMMVPIVCTLSRREGGLTEEDRQKLLELRAACQEASMTEHPVERIQRERKLSKLLYTYFSKLEAQNKIVEGGVFDRLVKDLEFIDHKLVSLQKVYNQEVQTWNHSFHRWISGSLLKIFRFRRFHLFEA